MIAELGHFVLVLALVVAAVQAIAPIYLARTAPDIALSIASRASYLQFILILLAFAALSYGFVRSDFSLAVVFANSHVAKPLIYKIAGVWGNHEGSMLLWVLIVAAYGAAYARFTDTKDSFAARVLIVQGWLGVAFLAFLLFTSNPVARLLPAPFSGQGLTPILQDPALAAHPPLLYAGYVGFSMAYAFALAALTGADDGGNWARRMRPWILTAWIFLTLGIALGS